MNNNNTNGNNRRKEQLPLIILEMLEIFITLKAT